MKNFLRGFVYASNGIWIAVNERNMRIHCLAVIMVTAAGTYFRLSREEWISLLLAMGLVLGAEGMNTAIELLVNLVRDDVGVAYANEKLGKTKDIAAGAVLICAVVAAIIGLMVFLPHLMSFAVVV